MIKLVLFFVLSALLLLLVMIPFVSCGDDDDDDTTNDDDAVDDDQISDDDQATDDDQTIDDDLVDDDAFDDDVTDDDTVAGPTWNNFAGQFFDDYCTRCHASTRTGLQRKGAPVGVDFDTYDLAVENADGAKERAVDGTSMPLGTPKPTTAEREQLGIWVDNGAPLQ